MNLPKHIKFVTFDEYHNKQMKDPKFRESYNSLEVEFQIIHDLIRKRIKNEISQKELAKRIGSDQATISRLETGNYNPTIKFLKKIAKAVGGKLEVKIV